MNKTKRIALISILALMGVVSCGPKNDSSQSTSSEVEKPVYIEKLEDAVKLTKFYDLYVYNTDRTLCSYYELSGEDYYSYRPSNIGFAVLNEDPGYLHQFYIKQNNTFDLSIDMKGRVALSSYMENTKNTRFMNIVEEFAPFFEQDFYDDTLFTAYSSDMRGSITSELKEYFQSNMIKYCNYFEFRVGKTGRIESFQAFEKSTTAGDDYCSLVADVMLTKPNINETPLIKDWREKGSIFNERVYDYKSLDMSNVVPKPLYQNGEVEATVTAIDFDGSFYVANKDNIVGPVGIKVVPNNKAYKPSINDIVKVSGDIVINNTGKYAKATYFKDADVSLVGKNNYAPTFNEETTVDSYGGGIYSAYYFANSPIFGGSLYNGYAYVSALPEEINEKGDTVVEFVCPDFTDNNKEAIKLYLHLPIEYGKDNIQSALDDLALLGIYNPKSETLPQMASLSNVIVDGGVRRGVYSVDLYAVSTSTIGHKMNFIELAEKEYGVTSLPTWDLGEESTEGQFHFGEVSDWYLEDQYSKTEFPSHVSGIFYYCYKMPKASVQKYFDGLNTLGYTLVDIVTNGYLGGSDHYIYNVKDDVYLDIQVPYKDDDGTFTIMSFMYRDEKIVRGPTIRERIDANCSSFFDSSEFIILDGTHDADYHSYSMKSWAGNDFSDNPLFVTTMNIQEDRLEELMRAYIAAGYKQYRPTGTRPFSYITRGATRTVMYKENSNGKKTFLDFGRYPTTDYTYAYHDKFNYRIEVAIYEGTEPISTQWTNDLTDFVAGGCKDRKDGGFELKIPDYAKAEVYMRDEDVDLSFGYSFNGNAFVYPSDATKLDELFSYICDAIDTNGIPYSYTTKKGTKVFFYSVQLEDNSYDSACFSVMKNEERGFVRIIDSIAGVDF